MFPSSSVTYIRSDLSRAVLSMREFMSGLDPLSAMVSTAVLVLRISIPS